MARDAYFILGAGDLQWDFVQTVREMGFETHVFDRNPCAVCAKIADVFHCISIDAREEILAAAYRYRPIAITTVATELGNLTACYIGERLQLCTNTYETALDTTNKCRMKRVLRDGGIPSARWIESTELPELLNSGFTYPVVVKAADSSAGRGVMRVDARTRLTEAFSDAQNASRIGTVIVEEYLDGAQYSLETISSRGKHHLVAITQETFDGSEYLIETRHMLPADLAREQVDVLGDLASKTLTAFKVRYGAGHIEVRATKDGFKVIEVATRTGGLRDFMIKEALGCDYNRLLVDASLGRPVEPRHSKNRVVVSVFLIRSSDYRLYTKMKGTCPDKLVRDSVSGFNSLRRPTTLMDSQGFFYLVFDNMELAKAVLCDEDSNECGDRS